MEKSNTTKKEKSFGKMLSSSTGEDTSTSKEISEKTKDKVINLKGSLDSIPKQLQPEQGYSSFSQEETKILGQIYQKMLEQHKDKIKNAEIEKNLQEEKVSEEEKKTNLLRDALKGKKPEKEKEKKKKKEPSGIVEGAMGAAVMAGAVSDQKRKEEKPAEVKPEAKEPQVKPEEKPKVELVPPAKEKEEPKTVEKISGEKIKLPAEVKYDKLTKSMVYKGIYFTANAQEDLNKMVKAIDDKSAIEFQGKDESGKDVTIKFDGSNGSQTISAAKPQAERVLEKESERGGYLVDSEGKPVVDSSGQPVKTGEVRVEEKKPEVVPKVKPEVKAEKVPEIAPPKKEEPKVEKAPPPVKEKPKVEKAPSVAGMEDAKQMIIKHEGLVPYPYLDTKGFWTIGVGHLMNPANKTVLPPGYEAWSKNKGPYDKGNNKTPAMSNDEIMKLFDKDFEYHKKLAEQGPGFEKANEAGKAAFIDLSFNMGAWWKIFKNAAKKAQEGDFSGTAEQLKDSKWYEQVKGRAKTIVGMISQAGDDKQNKPASKATPTPSTPPSSQVASASQTNKEMKDDLTKNKPTPATNTTKVVASNQTNIQKGGQDAVDDRPVYLKKAQA